MNEPGVLYIVATPIGNLEDISFRAIRILKASSLIAAEDTRQTKKLLNHLSISVPMISYFDHNKSYKTIYIYIYTKYANNIYIYIYIDV